MCAGVVKLGETGTTGTTLTLYLERSYSNERRNANRLSAPLQRQAASGKKQLRVRSSATHSASHTAENRKENNNGGEKSLCYNGTEGDIRPFIIVMVDGMKAQE